MIVGEDCVAPYMNSHLTDSRLPSRAHEKSIEPTTGKPARKHHSLLNTQCFSRESVNQNSSRQENRELPRREQHTLPLVFVCLALFYFTRSTGKICLLTGRTATVLAKWWRWSYKKRRKRKIQSWTRHKEKTETNQWGSTTSNEFEFHEFFHENNATDPKEYLRMTPNV